MQHPHLEIELTSKMFLESILIAKHINVAGYKMTVNELVIGFME